MNRRSGAVALVALAGACGFILMLWITQHGPGVSPDSTTYIEAARSILTGEGFSSEGKPLAHYPPAYPLLLAAAGFLRSGDILEGGRVLGALLFGINIALLGLAVYMCTERSVPAAGLAMLVFLVSPAVVSVHSMAWSEVPFITFYLSAFILISLHIARPERHLLWLGSLMAALALLTRYAGVSLLPAIALTLLLVGNRPVRQRVRDAVLATCVALIPLATWLVRNVVTAQTAMDRGFAFHPVGLSHVRRLVSTIHDLAFPVAGPVWMKALHLGIAGVLFLGALALLWRKGYTKRRVKHSGLGLPALCVIFFLTYLAGLLISISCFDAFVPLDFRLLVVASPPLTLALTWAARSTARVLDRRIIWYGFVVFALVSAGMNARRAGLQAVDTHKNGTGYTSRYWQESETVSYLSGIDDTLKVYSNGPDVIRFLTAKEAVMIPVKTFTATGRSNEDYEYELDTMCEECRSGEAVVAYLDGITWRWYIPSREELETGGNLPVLKRFEDGTLYALPRSIDLPPTLPPEETHSL